MAGSQAAQTAGEKPEFEFLCGALGAFGREECLSKLVLLGEGSLRRAVGEYVTHFLRSGTIRVKETFYCFRGERHSTCRPVALQGATGRPPEVLPPRGRMSFLTTRVEVIRFYRAFQLAMHLVRHRGIRSHQPQR